MVQGEAIGCSTETPSDLEVKRSFQARELENWISSSPAGWLRELRAGAVSNLLKSSDPEQRDELWRYATTEHFDLDSLLAAAPRIEKLGIKVSGFADSNQNLPEGVELLAGAQSPLHEFGVPLQELLLKKSAPLLDYARFDAFSDPWSWYQLAFHGAVTVIRVRANTEVKAPLSLGIDSLQSADSGSPVIPLVIVKLEPGAKLTLVDQFAVDSAEQHRLISPRIEAILGANSKLNFITAQNRGASKHYLARQRFWLRRDSHLSYFSAALGGSVARVDMDCVLLESGAHADLNGVAFGQGSQLLDFHPTQLHVAPHCYSNLQANCVLQDGAKVSYYGYVRVAEGAQKTDAYQKNRNLLLSSEARVDSVPNLEIKANDVKCSHGSSTSEIGKEELFYLMSRGLSKEQAEKLMVESFFEDLLPRVANSQIEEYLRAMILTRTTR